MKKISKQRQATYYIGNAISLIGILIFLSFFLQMMGGFSDSLSSSPFTQLSEQSFKINVDGQDVVVMGNAKRPFSGIRASAGPNFATPFIGMIMIISGQFVANIGKNGLAGSGVILNPEQAREDLQPYNIAKGQMLSDSLEEVQAIKSITSALSDKTTQGENPSVPLIKVRCSSCKSLNDESSKFCNQCGIPLT